MSVATASLVDHLLERLQGQEDLELEVKRARGGLPQDLWPTIGAFANTRGGWIVLGVEEREDGYSVEGVGNAPVLLQTLHGLMRNPQKISQPVCGATDASVEQVDEGKQVIVLRVPAAPRRLRPVYVNGNPYGGTYVRRHAGDFHCSKPEVDRMMREASDVAADAAILRGYTLDDLDLETLAGYRRRFQTANPASAWNRYDDRRFLKAIGAYGRDRERGEEGPTVAGLLLLGLPEAMRAWRARHLIDFRLLSGQESESLEQRWDDRLVWEGNLLGAFDAMYPRLVDGLPVPFRLQGAVRVSEGPAHVALREALVNLLVHADYAETAAALILRSPDGYTFRNPGSSRIPAQDLLTGDQSDPRNPELVRMFRLIGLAEEAGTGMSKILRAWRELGFRLPAVEANTERYEFKLTLRHAHPLDEEDREWLRTLGDTWSEAEQLALVWARREREIDNGTLRGLTGQHPADATRVLVSLRDRGLLQKLGAKRGARYQLGVAAGEGVVAETSRVEVQNLQGSDTSSEHKGASTVHSEPSSGGFTASPGDSHQKPPELDSSPGRSPLDQGKPVEDGPTAPTETRWPELLSLAAPVRERRYVSARTLEDTLAALCERMPLCLDQLVALLGRNKDYLRQVLRPLLASGRVACLHPEQPNHPRQKYVARREPEEDPAF